MDLTKIKRIFVNEDDTKEKAPPKVTATGQTAVIQAPVHTRTIAGKDYGKYLNGVMEKANLPGPDFFEFSKTLEGYEGQPIGEQSKYELAYAAFKTMGVTPEKLVSTANQYIGEITKEELDYAHFHSEEQKGIEAKKKEVQEIATENERLDKQIQDNILKSQKLNEAIYATSMQLASDKTGFENAANQAKAIISDRITKIKMYLNAGTTK